MQTKCIQEREKYFKWEWFRRSDWSNLPISTKELLLSTSFARVLKESNAVNCLDYLSGFGNISRELHKRGHSVIGYELSESAVRGAKLISSQEGSNIIYFQGYETTCPAQVLPHKLSSVYSTEILLEPNWHELKQEFSGIFEILNPGGFFMFVGAGEHKPFAHDVIAEFDSRAHESIVWCYKDGQLLCTKVFVKSREEVDYRDYKDLYIINKGNESRLELTEKRIPGYWNLHNIRDLCFEVGFCHFEIRHFKHENLEVTLNIAYKDGKLANDDKTYEEEQAYYDF